MLDIKYIGKDLWKCKFSGINFKEDFLLPLCLAFELEYHDFLCVISEISMGSARSTKIIGSNFEDFCCLVEGFVGRENKFRRDIKMLFKVD